MLKEDLVVNQVGSQGIDFSAYWWARLLGLISRLVLYLMSDEEFWVPSYANDQDFMASGPNAITNIVLILVFMSALRAQFSWSKSAGGITYEWIGYAQDFGRFKVGVSQSRADWLVKWIDTKLTTDRINDKGTSEVLGRFNFTVSAVDITKSFLGPIYMWAASVPEFAQNHTQVP